MEWLFWLSAFKAEYLRRTGITWEDGGHEDEDAKRYWPESTPEEAVLHQIEKYDLTDITKEIW